MNCSICKGVFSEHELKTVEDSYMCKPCFSAQLERAFSPKGIRKMNSAESKQLTSKRNARISRVEYVFFMIIIWLLLPAFMQFILAEILTYKSIHSFFPQVVFDVLRDFQPLQLVKFEGRYIISYNILELWFIQIPASIIYADGRIKDIGWKPWSAFILGLPVLNFILCLKKGCMGKNEHGEPVEGTSLGKRIFVYSSPVSVPLILFGLVSGKNLIG
ncbi:hypothetical protein VIBNISOn1_520004 [Vibrio nigripulchritudo SOn1]|uniref:Paraquat-inducible protein A n=1 Tax=Vibrio nigripulchritudo SOn1 TaxID=1238450 RepID=A0AAV2VUQ1_9VIBR|nr:hypothetical protein [Vibrio nigripulchritudo]CCO48416.1 hypothetical protein VIBNISOn1_520004 [Vibrio nigripulchritudo SOn1]